MFTASQLLEKINSHITNLQFLRTPKGLYDPVTYVLSMGGKRIRPVLMLMAYNLYKEDVIHVLAPATGIEVYHNYTLLHDDLMDRAERRRGKETVHKVWNDNTVILSGDAMLVLAYQFMAQCSVEHLKEVMDLFSLTALEICEGQQMDMEFEQRNDVKEEEYLEMIRLKTSVLLAASLKIGALLGGASRDDVEYLYNFGVNIGVAFQLKDDLLDVYGDATVFGKNIGGDILCNKKTYMLIKALEHANKEQLRQLNYWIEATDFNPVEKIESVTDLYNQIGVKELCENKMMEYSTQAMECLAAIKVADENKNELEKLMKALMYREV
ncbi:MAG: polyprenyl synthetase family protein [Bacteroides sp.]|nr:polyprenyl synthetase family protein [Bacteroides sp.]